MKRLIVIANRIPNLAGGPDTGGLAAALKLILSERGGIWAGWSGRILEEPASQASFLDAGPYSIAALDFSPAEYEGYYEQFANRILWPAFHGRLDLMRVDADSYSLYRKVNRRFAEAVLPLLKDDDLLWIHDYHLIPLGEELRQRAFCAPLGFFLHIPFPAPEVFAALPAAPELAKALTAYDLIGFQTETCVRNYLEYMRRHGSGCRVGENFLVERDRLIRAEAHPIGIDAQSFAAQAASPRAALFLERLKTCFADQAIVASVERLDYTKGIAERFRALERLLENNPHYAGRLCLCQIAAPSRLTVQEYRHMQAELEAISGRINARFSTFSWSPIRYLNRAVNHTQIAALFRFSRIGMVTPLCDGMNLVAKEYIAAQDADDPGVLVLSCFAGAARELEEAVIVNPYDSAAMAQALTEALHMPLRERQDRWQVMMRRLEKDNVYTWRDRFLSRLEEACNAHARSLPLSLPPSSIAEGEEVFPPLVTEEG